jgi:hypothetical protein
MTRARVGTIEWVKDHYRVRISLPDGTRPWIHLEPGVSETMAREKAAGLTEKAWKKHGTYSPTKGPKALAPQGTTIEVLSKPWLELVDQDPDLSPATKTMYKGCFKNHLKRSFGTLKPEKPDDRSASPMASRTAQQFRAVHMPQHLQFICKASGRRGRRGLDRTTCESAAASKSPR